MSTLNWSSRIVHRTVHALDKLLSDESEQVPGYLRSRVIDSGIMGYACSMLPINAPLRLLQASRKKQWFKVWSQSITKVRYSVIASMLHRCILMLVIITW
jgi:hypothetical protein